MEANAAEIQTGQLALQKAQSQEARTFAQKMVEDHTKSQQELRELAQSKLVTKVVPIVQGHLQMAEQAVARSSGKSDTRASGHTGTATSSQSSGKSNAQ